MPQNNPIARLLKDSGVTYGYVSDGEASRFWLRIAPDKVLPVEYADKIVPILMKCEEVTRE